MSQSQAARSLVRSARFEALTSATKVFFAIVCGMAFAGFILGALLGLGQLMALVLGLMSVPVAGWQAWRSWTLRDRVLANLRESAVRKWVAAGATPAEVARRSALLSEQGVANVFPLVRDEQLRAAQADRKLKVQLQSRARQRDRQATPAEDYTATSEMPQWSGNGQLLNACGLDSYGDGTGQTANRDFVEASFNSNTGQWAGEYHPPT